MGTLKTTECFSGINSHYGETLVTTGDPERGEGPVATKWPAVSKRPAKFADLLPDPREGGEGQGCSPGDVRRLQAGLLGSDFWPWLCSSHSLHYQMPQGWKGAWGHLDQTPREGGPFCSVPSCAGPPFPRAETKQQGFLKRSHVEKQRWPLGRGN